METLNTQLVIIGAGPGGYACAIRAGQLGIQTVIVEAVKPGGTCLNVGCIPSKALIHAADEYHRLMSFCGQQNEAQPMGITCGAASINLGETMDWKNGIVSKLVGGVGGLLRKANVHVIHGIARFRDGKSVIVESSNGSIQVHSQNIVIATGSEPLEIPSLPFSNHILSSTEALSLTSVPDTLAVVGGGYIGLELGTCFAKLGSRVSIVESAHRLLPSYDEELTRPIVKRLEQLSVNVSTSAKAVAYDSDKAALRIAVDDEQSTINADKVLVTVGRRARLSGWGLSELSLTTRNGFVAINEQCQTSMRGVYAIGDVSGEPMLAHRAMAQGEMVARIVAGQSVTWDKQCIPAVCFTDPELISAGLSIEEAKAAGEDFSVVKFPFSANGRAMTLQREDGFVRVVYRNGDNVILGLQAAGAGVAELSAAFSIAMEMGARADDIAATIHAHPTMSEGLQEACMNAIGSGLHT